ncbi:YdcF family protein [Corynebacterium sp. 335C]
MPASRRSLPLLAAAAAAALLLVPAAIPADATPASTHAGVPPVAGDADVLDAVRDGTRPVPDGLLVPVPGAGSVVLPSDQVADAPLAMCGADVLQPDLIPSGSDLLSAAALRADQMGRAGLRDAAIAFLPKDRARLIRMVIGQLHSPVSAPDHSRPGTIIAIPGRRLTEDGGIDRTLELRLREGLRQAELAPAAPVVVSGGETAPGRVEAEEMASWLADHGLPESRIIVEDRALSTIANAAQVQRLIPDAGGVIVVTSESHLRRAVIDMQLAYGTDVPVTGSGAPDDLAPGQSVDWDLELRAAYRDAILWQLSPAAYNLEGIPPIFFGSPASSS